MNIRNFVSKLLSMQKIKLSKQYSVPKKSSLGQGGNGVVCKVIRNSDKQAFALKRLSDDARTINEKILRFQDEIDTLIACQRFDGVIPIVDYSKKELWYTMPLADKIDSHITTIDAKVNCVLQIAEVLKELHQAGYAHRDIKPENILYYNGRFVLCDFGLVEIPDNSHHLTKNSSRIGPMNTIAPEMQRNARDADGKKADVYSLAKTLWILLSGKRKGFNGVYRYDDSSIALNAMSQFRGTHLVEIEELLMQATSNDPDDRPSMDSFHQSLLNWQDVSKDEIKKSQSNWHFLLKRLFGNSYVPSECSWDSIDSIVKVLEEVNRLPISRYMFFPDGGDLDFVNVKKASEEGCIDIISNLGYFRVKPRKLIFEKFDVSVWNYFLLELNEQNVTVGDCNNEYVEEVVEDTPAHYVSAKSFNYGVYDYDSGKPLPRGSRIIIRYLKGKFLFVLKLGPYNFIQKVTDGRHNNCTSENFKNYVNSLQNLYRFKEYISEEKRKQLIEALDQIYGFNNPIQWPFDTKDSHVYEKDYAKKNYMKFDFSDEIMRLGISVDSPLAEYLFQLENIDRHIFMELLYPDCKFYYLRKDGKVEKMKPADSSVFTLGCRQEPVALLKALNEKIKQYVIDKVDPLEQPYFIAKINLVAKPSHLFTREEIKAEMRAADDRIDNILVISIDGSAHIIPYSQNTSLYPVIHETWCAGNNYVGRYSTLSCLDSAYHYCLAKWYDYLKYGYGQPMEDWDSCSLSVEELVEKIKKI